MSALALRSQATVPIGVTRNQPSKKQKTVPRTKKREQEVAPERGPKSKKTKEGEGEEQEEPLDENSKAIQNRIEELLALGVKGDDPKAGWKPLRDSQDRVINLPPADPCCTGGTFAEYLPEDLRVAKAPPKPVEPRVIDDPEAWAAAQQAEKEEALLMRMRMSEEEWNAMHGDKRRKQIESIKKGLDGYKRYREHVPLKRRQDVKSWTTHPVTPDASNRRFSKRGWAGAVRTWANLVQQSWGTESEGDASRSHLRDTHSQGAPEL
tara:strand:- start:2099 stop:2893 length:795 start_codon:yes stop_codon:yes gene_type:complete